MCFEYRRIYGIKYLIYRMTFLMNEDELSFFFKALAMITHDKSQPLHDAARMLGDNYLKYLVHIEGMGAVSDQGVLPYQSYVLTTLKLFLHKPGLEYANTIIHDMEGDHHRGHFALIGEDANVIERLRTVFHSHDAAEFQIIPVLRTKVDSCINPLDTAEAQKSYLCYLLYEIKHGHAVHDALRKLATWREDVFSEASDGIIEQDGFNVLFNLVNNSPEVEIVRYALMALFKHTVQQSFGETADHTNKQKFVARILELLFSSDIETAKYAIYSLQQMFISEDETIRCDIIIPPCIRLLSLSASNVAIQHSVLEFLVYVTDRDEDYRQAIYRAGGIPVLVGYIPSHFVDIADKSLAFDALNVLGNLAIDSLSVKKAIHDAHGIEMLLPWLKQTNDDYLKSAILRALSLICRDNEANQQLLFDRKGVDLLFSLLHSHNLDVVQRAVNTLAQVSHRHDIIQKFISNHRDLPVLFGLLSDKHEEKMRRFAIVILVELSDNAYCLPILSRYLSVDLLFMCLRSTTDAQLVQELLFIIAQLSFFEVNETPIRQSEAILEQLSLPSCDTSIRNYANTALNNLSLFRARKRQVEMGAYSKAIEEYTRFLQRDPAHLAALLERASIYEKLQNYKNAFSDYELVLKLNPDLLEESVAQEGIRRINELNKPAHSPRK